MSSKIFKRIRKSISNDSRRFVRNSFEFVELLQQILKEKNISQRMLAEKLGKNESEISKMLSPGHNITLKTLSKIEVAIGADLLRFKKSKKVQPTIKIIHLGQGQDVKRIHKRAKYQKSVEDSKNQPYC